MYVLLALLLLGVLITAHEAGHFLAARACGIEVEEFSMGMGPKLLQRRSRRGTLITLRLLPIGGFCQFYGEDREPGDNSCFNSKPVWKRAVTVASGPLMNFVVAMLVIVLYMSAMGLETVVPRVALVEDNAAQAGLRIGDELLTVNGAQIETTNDVTRAIAQSGGEPVTLGIGRAGETVELTIAPFYDAEVSRYRLGFTFDQERVRVSLLESIPFSFQYNVECVKAIFDALRGLIFHGEGVQDVTGPVGTVYVIQEVTQEGGIDVYLRLIALISVNLGVMNLLPIPGLDGSRLLFMLVEAVRRRPISREIEGRIHFAGFCLLMLLMVVLTYKDIMQIFVR